MLTPNVESKIGKHLKGLDLSNVDLQVSCYAHLIFWKARPSKFHLV